MNRKLKRTIIWKKLKINIFVTSDQMNVPIRNHVSAAQHKFNTQYADAYLEKQHY